MPAHARAAPACPHPPTHPIHPPTPTPTPPHPPPPTHIHHPPPPHLAGGLLKARVLRRALLQLLHILLNLGALALQAGGVREGAPWGGPQGVRGVAPAQRAAAATVVALRGPESWPTGGACLPQQPLLQSLRCKTTAAAPRAPVETCRASAGAASRGRRRSRCGSPDSDSCRWGSAHPPCSSGQRSCPQ